jgi:parallel beta-helix repeat protein
MLISFSRLNIHHLVKLCLIAWCALFCVAAQAQTQHYYVSVENGSDANDGSLASPWKTVTWALTGSHAPLKPSATVYLIGSDQMDYGWDSGESFPWTLKNNVSLVGAAGPNGEGATVNSSGNDNDYLIRLHPEQSYESGEIRGIEFKPRRDFILLSPAAGRIHAPRIRNCEFSGKVIGRPWDDGFAEISPVIESCKISGNIDLRGSEDFLLAPRIARNQIFVPVNNGIYFWCGGGQIKAEILANGIDQDMDSGAIHIGGESSEGRVVVEDNLIRGIQNVMFDDWAGLQFKRTTAEVQVRRNRFEHMAYGLKIVNSPFWNPNSVIEDNHFASKYGNGVLIDKSTGVELRKNWIISQAGGCLELRDSYDCRIIGNQVGSSTADGVLISGTSADIEILNNRILGNGDSGIVVAGSEGHLIAGNLIAAQAGDGIKVGGIVGGQALQLIHNTIANNNGYGISTSLPQSHPMYLSNSILWGNGLGDMNGFFDGQYQHNNIQIGGNLLDGNISQAPVFMDPLSMDYHLMDQSPCIDAGTNDGLVFPTDADGDPRLLDGDWSLGVWTDMGFDERSDCGLQLKWSGQHGAKPMLHIHGLPAASYRAFAAVGVQKPPLAAAPGNHVGGYGTVLLDLSRVVDYPLVRGTLDGSGYASFAMEIPPQFPNGWYLSVQAAIRQQPSAIQLTNAVTLRL